MTKTHLQSVLIESMTGRASSSNQVMPSIDTVVGPTINLPSDVAPYVLQIGRMNPDYWGTVRKNRLIHNAGEVFDQLNREGRSDLIETVNKYAAILHPEVAPFIQRHANDAYLSSSR